MVDQNASVSELMELERECLRKFQAGDVDYVMDNLLAENALVCPPGIEAVFGRENQRAMFKEFLGMEGVELSWDPIEAHVSPSEEMGYVYGWVNWKMPGDAAETKGKYISVWIKEDGEWRNAVEIRNSNG